MAYGSDNVTFSALSWQSVGSVDGYLGSRRSSKSWPLAHLHASHSLFLSPSLPLYLSPSLPHILSLSLSLSQSLSFCHDLRCKALGFGSKSLAAEESRAFRRPKSRSRGTLGCCLAFSSLRGSQGGVWGGGLGMGSLPLLFCKASALGFQTPIPKKPYEKV